MHLTKDVGEHDSPVDIYAEMKVTPAMISAGLLEFENRFPDVVLSEDDAARFLTRVFLAMVATLADGRTP